MILFLDFDGVLHPDAVYLIGAHPILARGGRAFMWAQPFIDLLDAHPEVSIVLSTPWVRHLGFSRAKAALPESLRKRVIGSTWHSVVVPRAGSTISDSENWFDNATRYEQIVRSATRANLSSRDWLAIDNGVETWPHEMRHCLVKTDRKKGLSCPVTLAELKTRLVENGLIRCDPDAEIIPRTSWQLRPNIQA